MGRGRTVISVFSLESVAMSVASIRGLSQRLLHSGFGFRSMQSAMGLRFFCIPILSNGHHANQIQRFFSTESRDLMNRILQKYPPSETKRQKTDIISDLSRQKLSLETV